MILTNVPTFPSSIPKSSRSYAGNSTLGLRRRNRRKTTVENNGRKCCQIRPGSRDLLQSHMKHHRAILVAVLLPPLAAIPATEVKLAAIFSDHIVLKR